MALQALSAEDMDRFGFVSALVRAPDTAADAYRAMVEENEIRADLSFYERARIAVKSVEQGIFPDAKTAVQSLFSAARAPKRSKILSFAVLVDALDDDLRFPTAIPEKLGLPLVAGLQERVGFKRQLTESLHRADPQDAAAERAVLEGALKKSGRAPKAPRGEAIASGIALKVGKGRVVLSGKGVDKALLQDLRAWLATRCR
jgi:ParB family chromosome partitioning protein